MSTEPTMGENETTETAAPAAPAAATASAAKAAEASKLFDKLFSNTEPEKKVSIPNAVAPKVEEGEIFTRKVVNETDEQTFQRVVQSADDSATPLPDRFVDTPKEVAVPPPLRKAVETIQVKTRPEAQDIPTAVDAVVSDKVKAELLAKAKAAKYAAKPEINFPERVNNLKTQHDQLRARLASLESQE